MKLASYIIDKNWLNIQIVNLIVILSFLEILLLAICNNAKYSTPQKMGASALPVIAMTLFWGIVGIVLPIILPKGPNRK